MISLINIFRLLFFIAVITGIIFLKPPVEVNLINSLKPAFSEIAYPLGTDRLGRNVYALFSYGILITLLLAIPARLVTIMFAAIISFLVYYAGKFLEYIFQSLSSVFISIPSLLIALIIIQVFSSGIFILFVAITLADWALVYETFQNKIQDIKNTGYVTSSMCFGANKLTIFRKHILSGIYPVSYLLFVTGIPSVIMTLSIFSFLGVSMGNDWFGPGLGEQIAFSKDYFEKSMSAVISPVLGILFMIYIFSSTGKEKS